MKKIFFLVGVVLFGFINSAAAVQTATGKIVSIETRAWGLLVQTDFGFSGATGIDCAVNVGATYMYDFLYARAGNSPDASMEKSILLTAYTTGRDISFHIYECNSNNNRPIIGYIRLK